MLHVLANGDLIIANQNAVKSGQNAGTSKDYEITLVPKNRMLRTVKPLVMGT